MQLNGYSKYMKMRIRAPFGRMAGRVLQGKAASDSIALGNSNPVMTEQIMERRPLVVIGSSSTEMFDYLFGNNPAYFPYWASGWSARGLRAKESHDYLRKLMRHVPTSAHVLLNFGCTDVLFNARYKAVTTGTYDFRNFLEEARDGILCGKRFLNDLGYMNVTAVFTSPVIPLPQKYWNRRGKGRQLPNPMIGHMYYDLHQLVRAEMPVVDFFAESTDGPAGGYLLRKKFRRQKDDHHPDYTAIGDLLWSKISNLPDVLPPRATPLIKIYPHLRENIRMLMAEGRPRTRTCI